MPSPHLHKVPTKVKFIESESTLVDARGQGVEVGRGNGDLVFNGDRVSVSEDEGFGRWMMVMMVRAAQQCDCA